MWHSFHVKVWQNVAGAPDGPISEPSVLTIGVFDGVHRGHQTLLRQVKTLAQQEDLVSIAVTFDPHPTAVLFPDRAPKSLTSIERRIELLHEYGMDHVRVLSFSKEMSAWSPSEFLDRVVVSQCSARKVIVGENFRFGARAAGDFTFIQQYGERHGYEAYVQDIAGDTENFSSTRVREALGRGDVSAAADVLGRHHEIEGMVVHGDHRGRKLGFPTANVLVDDHTATPADGVYAGWLVLGGTERLPAAISVGTNPTFDGVEHRRIESYVLDRTDLDLYDEHVRVEFVDHIRSMRAFDGIDALIVAMNQDVAQTRETLELRE